MAHTQSQLIEVKRTRDKGRGVFARHHIDEGQVIERVPVLVVPMREISNGNGRVKLEDYCFMWGRDTYALALGYGSMYNHSYQPNARYDDVGRLTKEFTALRDIEPGEEITINYNGDPDDDSPLWFDALKY